MNNYEKLSEYAKRVGFQYRTVWNWYKAGKIPDAKMINGNIVVLTDDTAQNTQDKILQAVTYARVSSSENKANLVTQSKRLGDFATANGYTVLQEVKEIGSGLNDKRPKLKQVFNNKDWDILVVEHKDRLTRFGFEYLHMLAESQGRKIVVINQTEDETDDLMTDFVSIITSFCSRLYGLRRSKRKTKKIIKELENG